MLPSHLLSMVFMSQPNPILQWNSGYLQTDSPALQVFDQSRPSLLSIRPLLVVQQPDLGSAPRPHCAPRALEASAGPAAPGPRLAGDWGCGGRSATGHPDRRCALRRRPARGPGSGGAAARPGRGCGPLRGPRAGSPGARLSHGRGSASAGWGFPPPGGRARRGRHGGGVRVCVGGGGDAAPPGQGPEARTPQPPSDSESESPKEVRPGVPGALLPQPEPRRPLPTPRASGPGPAAGSSMRCSAGAAAIPRAAAAAAAAAAPLRPGGAAHPPSLPRTARRRSAPGPRPGHRPG